MHDSTWHSTAPYITAYALLLFMHYISSCLLFLFVYIHL